MKKLKRNIIIPALLILIYFFMMMDLNASSFISIGSGGVLAVTDENDENRNKPGIPFMIEYQYSSGYRDSLMFNSSLSCIPLYWNDSPENIFICSAGAMYVKPFYNYRSNLTEIVFHKSTCIGTMLLPVTVMRDVLNNVFQVIIPHHPFAFLDMALIKESGETIRKGFSAGAGFTSGGVDVRLRYTQNINFSSMTRRDIYVAGIEFTLNMPLQQQFVRTEPLRQ